MAAIGIYGLIQYSVATRTQEIRLRLALGAGARPPLPVLLGGGATPRRGRVAGGAHICGRMLAEGLTLSLTGVALGLVGAWWLGRAGSSLLSGVAASDPLPLTTVPLVVAGVAL